jgi:hypothetical protein
MFQLIEYTSTLIKLTYVAIATNNDDTLDRGLHERGSVDERKSRRVRRRYSGSTRTALSTYVTVVLVVLDRELRSRAIHAFHRVQANLHCIY